MLHILRNKKTSLNQTFFIIFYKFIIDDNKHYCSHLITATNCCVVLYSSSIIQRFVYSMFVVWNLDIKCYAVLKLYFSGSWKKIKFRMKNSKRLMSSNVQQKRLVTSISIQQDFKNFKRIFNLLKLYPLLWLKMLVTKYIWLSWFYRTINLLISIYVSCEKVA